MAHINYPAVRSSWGTGFVIPPRGELGENKAGRGCDVDLHCSVEFSCLFLLESHSMTATMCSVSDCKNTVCVCSKDGITAC